VRDIDFFTWFCPYPFSFLTGRFRRRHNKLEDQYMNTPNRLDYADVYLLNVEVRQFQKKVKVNSNSSLSEDPRSLGFLQRSCESEVRGSPIKSIRDATWQPTGVGSTTPANHTRKLSTMSSTSKSYSIRSSLRYMISPESSAYSHSGNVDEYRRKRRRSGKLTVIASSRSCDYMNSL
jgi:hypothetical protein